MEELLLSNNAIADAIVFGLEDLESGYKIRAIVQLKGATSATEIQNDCKSKAPTYLVPKEIFIVDTFPKTASGKIDRPKVKKESLEKHGN